MQSKYSIQKSSSIALAIAAVIALVWSATAWRAEAQSGPSESTIVTVAPQRILDTRDGVDLGLPGPFVSAISQKLQVTGSVHTANGTMQVVPAEATGVLLNVTAVRAKADGFLSVRPGDASGAPTTSSLNFKAGVTTPNAVQVSLPTSGAFAGKIDIVYDALGVAGPTTDVLVDVVGYTTRQGLDDLTAELATKANTADVYTKTETDGALDDLTAELATKANTADVYTKTETDGALDDLTAELATKANTADVYTKTEADAAFVPHGAIVLAHGTSNMSNHGPGGDPATKVLNFALGTVVSGDGVVTISLDGPATLGGVDYRLSSLEYCIDIDDVAGAQLGVVWIHAQNTSSFAESFEFRTLDGCYSVNADSLPPAQAYGAEFFVSGGPTTELTFVGMQSTWVPVATP